MNAWGLFPAGLAAHCLTSASVMGRKPDNGQPPGGSPRKIPSEVHRTEAAFSSFSEGAGLDFPGFASLSWADTE